MYQICSNLKLIIISFIMIHVVHRVNCELEAEFGRIITYDNFEHYKTSMNKSYDHEFHEARSRQAYEQNMRIIRDHNQRAKSGHYSFELRANSMADLTPRQYLKKYVRLKSSAVLEALDHAHIKSQQDPVLGSAFGGLLKRGEMTSHDPLQGTDDDIPETLDWRELGFKTEPKNQKSCGSCYAFSIAMSIEGQIFKRTNRLVSLSEQQIIDCSIVLGNHGCAGGSLRNTLRYLATTRGLMRDEDYPYMSTQDKCNYRPDYAVVNITDWAILPRENEDAMKKAIARVGPIAISINASPATFQLYSHGIYDDPDCSSSSVNHAMLAIGYTPDYWILKNWWGEHWGENGYMKIKRNQNMCGLSNYAAYAVV